MKKFAVAFACASLLIFCENSFALQESPRVKEKEGAIKNSVKNKNSSPATSSRSSKSTAVGNFLLAYQRTLNVTKLSQEDINQLRDTFLNTKAEIPNQAQRVSKWHKKDGNHSIRAKDVNPKGLIIDEPGVYPLCEDIVFSPNNHGTKSLAAITIAANNVTLLLNGKTLSQGPATPGGQRRVQTNGIFIAPGVDATIIEGSGRIEDFTRLGIYSSGVSNLNISKIKVLRCGTSVAPSFSLDVSGGIGLFFDRFVVVQDSEFLDCFGAGGSNLDSDTTLFERCKFDGTQGIALPGFGIAAWGFLGLAVNQIINPRFVDCVYTNNRSAGIGEGMEFGNLGGRTKNFEAVRCYSANNGGALGGAIALDAQGFNVENTDGFTFRDCTAEGNHPGVGTGVSILGVFCGGFRNQNGTDGVYENCISLNNTSDVSGIAPFFGPGVFGFLNRGSKNIVYRRCVALGNQSVNPAAPAWGFYIFDDVSASAQSDTIFYEDCIAQENGYTGPNIVPLPQSGGFNFVGLTHSKIVNSSAQRNFGIGMLVADSPFFGFASSSNVIEQNEINSNSTNGILDTNAATAQTAYIANEARSNVINYSGLPTNTPIRLWTIGLPPSGPVDPIANLDILP